MSNPDHLKEGNWSTNSRSYNGNLQGGTALFNALAAYQKATDENRVACLEAVKKNATAIKGRLDKTPTQNQTIIKYLADILAETAKELKAAPGGTGADPAPGNTNGADAPPVEAEEEPVPAEPDKQVLYFKKQVALALGAKSATERNFAAFLAPKGGAAMIGNVSGANGILPRLAGGGSGSLLTGQYLFEDAIHTFIVPSASGGLASRLSRALHVQLGVGVKLRVRNRDKSAILNSETDTDPEEKPAATNGTAPTAEAAQAFAAKLEEANRLLAQMSETGRAHYASYVTAATAKASAELWDKVLESLKKEISTAEQKKQEAAEKQKRLDALKEEATDFLGELTDGDEKDRFTRIVEGATQKNDEDTWEKVIEALEPLAEAAMKERDRKAAAAQRLAAEARERDRLAAEVQERERLAAEARERDRLAAEARERDRLAAEALERDRLAAEARERDRLAAVERDRLAAVERDRLAAEAQREREHLAAEARRLEAEAQQRERDRIAAEAQRQEEQRRQAAAAVPVGPTASPADLTRALSENEQNLLGRLPRELADGVLQVLRTAEAGLAANGSMADVNSKLTEARRKLAVATRAKDQAVADNKQDNLDLANAGTDAQRRAPIIARVQASFAAFNAANGEATQLEKDIEELDVKKAAIAKSQRTDILMRGALRTHPLFKAAADPGPVAGLTDAQKTDRRQLAARRRAAAATALRHFAEHPALVTSALDIIQEAEHPENAADAIAKAGELQNGNFAGKAAEPGEAAAMATNALRLAGMVGGNDFAARLAAYYQSDDAKQPDDLRATGTNAEKKTTINYTAALGGSLLGSNGGLALNTPAFQGMRDRLHFHPDSLKKPMFNLARHVEGFSANMADPAVRERCERALNGIVAPPAVNAAARLVKKSVGLAPDATLNIRATRQAVLSAAITPLTQGDVGSCFATAAVMDYQETDPAGFFEDLTTIAQTGTLTKGGDPARVVKKVAADENGLLRGLEYTVATLAGRNHASNRKTVLSQKAHHALIGLNSFAQFEGMSKSGKAIFDAGRNPTGPDAAAARQRAHDLRQANTRRVAGVIRDALSYEYDSTREAGGTSADNSSSKGGWVLRAKATGEKIRDHNQIREVLKQAVLAELGADAGDEQNIAAVVGHNSVLNVITDGYAYEQYKDGKTHFMETRGGSSEDTMAILAGRQIDTKDIVAARVGSETPSSQAKRLLVGLVDQTKEAEGDTVALGIDQTHAERGLAKHPSLDALKSGGDVAAAVEETYRQSRQRATSPMTAEETEALVEKAASGIVFNKLSGKVPPLPATLSAGGLRPAQLKEQLLASLPVQAFADAGFTNPQGARNGFTAELDSWFIGELFPQFVVADTNWGDAAGKYFHVIAADLATGAPKLFKKEEATGALSDTGANFENKKWELATPKA